MRDLLPLLAHGALAPDEAARVRVHAASCASCAAELAVLGVARGVFDGVTPSVDVAAIVAALPPAPGARPALRLEVPRRRVRVPRYALAAAASLILVATLSVGALRVLFDGPGRPDSTDVASAGDGANGASVPVEILGAGGLSELGSEELTALLAELEAMEATVAAEPTTMRQAVTPPPEGI
jgi:hypothetical protein